MRYAPSLPGTQPLTEQTDFAEKMVAGLNAYLLRETIELVVHRSEKWQRDLSSPSKYTESVEPNRVRFRAMIGVVDPRLAPALELVAPFTNDNSRPGLVGISPTFTIDAVRWHVLHGVEGEGLLLLPSRGEPLADIVALPECDCTPEMLAGLAPGLPRAAQYARRLAETGCRVIVPTLMNREDTHSGMGGVAMTNQTHREFIYRAAYEMGRHIIGYEVQKTLAAVDWLVETASAASHSGGRRPVGVIGYGEGGLIAFYSAACDSRIDSAAVSGYFQPRELLWQEPIYRNVFGLLSEFGDAEIASLIAPRSLIVEASLGPEVPGPPQTGRNGAAPGAITLQLLADVRKEVDRTRELTAGLAGNVGIQLVGNGTGLPGSTKSIVALLKSLCIDEPLLAPGTAPARVGPQVDVAQRLKRQFMQLADHTQNLMLESPDRRREFWSHSDFSTPQTLESTIVDYRNRFSTEILGELRPPTLPTSPRTRQIYDTPAFVGYEVTLDLYPDIFAYGILLVPKGIQAGEKRAVIVCQHGLEGRPQDVADPAIDSPYYHQFACKLAEQGYITFSPQNPYIGGDQFRLALRKAQPLKLTLWSFIVRQHERILQWLSAQPNVDPARIAFYGLSYGGKAAMRVPAVLPGYCLSICSADFNEWIWKNVSMRSRYSYLLWGEYDMPEFNLGNTFNYAEMSWLICPRPFMVERGLMDGVAPDEWVAYEYARTRRVYELLGLGDCTEIDVFNGPHTINGIATFEFLRKHLNHAGVTRINAE